MDHNYIGSEHILLGLLREGEGVSAKVLERLELDAAKIRNQARSMLNFTRFACPAPVIVTIYTLRNGMYPFKAIGNLFYR